MQTYESSCSGGRKELEARTGGETAVGISGTSAYATWQAWKRLRIAHTDIWFCVSVGSIEGVLAHPSHCPLGAVWGDYKNRRPDPSGWGSECLLESPLENADFLDCVLRELPCSGTRLRLMEREQMPVRS